MITIRSSEGLSEPSLIGLEATITTPTSVLTMASDGPIVDHTSPFGGGLFGAMSWPRSRFQLAPGIVLEQQMFLPHDGSGAAFSWELRGGFFPARLTVRPFFLGCGPRTYRDAGFQYEPEEDGGRLIWLPSVRGPKIIADTNADYHDEPLRTLEPADPENAPTTSDILLVAPGRFEFALTKHPSILIFCSQGRIQTERDQYIGAFLASLAGRDRFETANASRRTGPPSPIPLVQAA
jgi:hypothetical protein